MVVYFLSSSRGCTFFLGLDIGLFSSQAGTAMLVLLRVTALWPNKIVLAIPLGVRGSRLNHTECDHCSSREHGTGRLHGSDQRHCYICAINYAIGIAMMGNSPKVRMRAFVGGLTSRDYPVPWAAVYTNIIVLVVVKLPNLAAFYHSLLIIPGYAIVNALACLVFRKIEVEFLTSDGTMRPTDTSMIPLHGRPPLTDMEAGVQKETRKFEHGTDEGEISKTTSIA
ncbi:hypothetical protein K438DRAFT_1774652 [Mycena galopus ATCC 62051]|nr:hypothetical protein K438DRAFT_1774652 [Mycena galopus ATCC 62051]